MDKHFEDMMRKKVEADRLKTEQESIEFWHAKLTEIKHEQTLETCSGLQQQHRRMKREERR